MTDVEKVTLSGAISLIPKLADDRGADSIEKRLQIADPYIRVAAALEMLNERLSVPTSAFRSVMKLTPLSEALRVALVDAALRLGRREWAQQLLSQEMDETMDGAHLNRYLAQAIYENDWRSYVKISCALFMATGSSDYLLQAADAARENISWQQAWPLYLRLFFIGPPPHANLVITAMQMFQREGLEDKFRTIGELTKELSGCSIPTGLWIAQCHLYEKRNEECVHFLENSGCLDLNQKIASAFWSMYAQALERLGRFPDAFNAYKRQNEIEATERYTYSGFIESIHKRASLLDAPVPGEEAQDVLICTGFPRSGTTLLENALDAHPEIGTAEETGAFSRTYSPARNEFPNSVPDAVKEHRHRYYAEIRRLSSKGNVAIHLDKTPILSASIEYLANAFPRMQYVFSIRHPYDVVLSNFKQRYEQNSAMAAFNDFQTTCDLYNRVMTSWFTVFPDASDRVCYVRYDQLVTEFEPTIRRVIDFLGVNWNDKVLNFTEHSKTRAVRTPSYANIRKGLTLGVQSSYSKYLFLFDDYCRSKLDPWVEFFGYTVEEPRT